MLNTKNIAWLIIDWGSSQLRIFAMDQNNHCIDKYKDNMGLLHVDKNQFSDTLETILIKWIGSNYKELPIYLGGMVGAKQGWVEVPYVKAPANIASISANMVELKASWGGQCYFVPGVEIDKPIVNKDAMRGEEIQVIGADKLIDQESYELVLPGTHSKHVRVTDNTLLLFSTYMTGELYSILKDHSILLKGVSEHKDSILTFKKGVLAGINSELTKLLFSVRTNQLFNNILPTEASEYLSGLLIGNEISNLEKDVFVIGEQKICQKYITAINLMGFNATYLDGDECFIEGMIAIKEYNNHEH